MSPMLKFRLVAALLFATALSPVWADEPLRGVALVIGQGKYAELTALPNPERDARAMDDLLDDLGFEVTRVLNGDAEEMREEIAEFIADAADADVALVYYSGHGVELGGQNYLIPVDADISTPHSAGQSLVPVDEMLAQLARTVPVTIVLLDACRTDAFPRGTVIELPGSAGPLMVEGPGLEAVRGPTPITRPDVPAESLGMVIGFAASPGQPALDGPPGGNSPYAAALLKHLRAGGYAFGDVMAMVSEEVYLETDARQLPWTNSSLRRFLTFGEATEEAGTDEALIRDGRRGLLLTVAGTPPAARALVEATAAEEGLPLEALYGMLKVLGVETDAGKSLDSQLRQGAEQLKTLIAQRQATVRTDPELIRLADLADRAEAEGAIEVALVFRERAAARADALARDVDRDEAAVRENRLEIAATYVDYGNTASLNFDFAAAAGRYLDAFAQVEKWDADLAIDYQRWAADALYYQGYYGGDIEAVQASIAAYEKALRLAPREEKLAAWGAIQNNIGLAYTLLGDWQGDRTMLERAATAFKNAISVWPEGSDWALAQGNLAGVLSKLGQRDLDAAILADSMRAYEAALGATDPTDVVTHAIAETNYATSIVLLATQTDDLSAVESAIAGLRRALAGLEPGRQPLAWTVTQNSLGSALKLLGDDRRDAALLGEAVAAFRAVLEAPGTDRSALDWGATQNNLGNTLVSLGRVTNDAAPLDAALVAHELALGVIAREIAPLNWANVQHSIGTTWYELGNVKADPGLKLTAAGAYALALEERTRERVPLLWAETQRNRANALRDAGIALGDVEALDAAAQAYADLVDFNVDRDDAREWAAAMGNLGWVLVGIGQIDADAAVAADAVEAILQSLTVWTRADTPHDWAIGHENLALALGLLGVLEADSQSLRDGLAALDEAGATYAGLGIDTGGRIERLRQQLEGFIVLLEQGAAGEPSG